MPIKYLGPFVILAVLMTAVSSHALAQAVECTSMIKAVEVNGTTLHYAECGRGDTVVLVHGSTGDLNSLSRHAQLLASEFRTIVYSRRFHFPNDPPQEGDAYALRQHVNDLAALIHELNLGQAHVVGHSYGGYVGLVLALEYPDLVRSLIMGEPPVLPMLSNTSVGKALRGSFDRRVKIPARDAYEQGEMQEGLRRFLNGVIYPGWFDKLPPDVQTEMVERAGPEHRLEILTETSVYMPPVSCEALAELGRPALLMTGERSHARFLLVTAELEECLIDESYVMVPEVGHGMFSNVSFTNDAILTFLNGQ